MSKIIKITATDGTPFEFEDEIRGSGGMKDCYFSPDRSYVVLFYRELKEDYRIVKDRLLDITGRYEQQMFRQSDVWRNYFCWPYKVVEYNGKLGVIAPFYDKSYFFKHGSANNDMLNIRNKEKNGKWFASAVHFNRHLDAHEKGDWRMYFRLLIRVARAVKKLHAAGLAHSDLSFNNVLIDPISGNACLIDIDDLVVPQKIPPKVIGTAGFIAPEVMMTKHLSMEDAHRKQPSRLTDQHALAVLIYLYLLHRHPLEGGKIHDMNDPQRDEELMMGEKAVFTEHPTDGSNRPNLKNVNPKALSPTPWADISKLPYTICGPYLKELFDRTFIDSLHNPQLRPTADEWETGLIKTVDLMQPCQSPTCSMKWYVFDNSNAPKCPFCGTPYRGDLPVLNLYSKNPKGSYTYEKHRLMVYNNQYIYQWHSNRRIVPSEGLTDLQKKPVGYFVFHNAKWLLVNQNLPDLQDLDTQTPIPIGKHLELKNNQQIMLSTEEGGRMIVVQIVANP